MSDETMRAHRIPRPDLASQFVRATMFLVALCLPSQTIILATTPQDDKGLLPPVDADRSPRVGAIRKSITSGDLMDAQKLTDELIRHEPSNFEGYFWRGFLELQRENGYDAVRFFRRAEVLNSNVWVLKSLAVSYYTVRQFKLFTLKMNEAMQKQPEDYAPYYYLGRYYVSEQIGDFDKAAEYFRKAIKRKADHYQSYYYLGYCFEAGRNVEDGERCYQQSRKISQAMGIKFSLAYEGMARLKLLQNKPAEAPEYAKHSVELSPNEASTHRVLAKAYEASGRSADAIPEWELTAKLDPTDASPYYHLYRIYLASGREDKAKLAYAEFKKLSATY